MGAFQCAVRWLPYPSQWTQPPPSAHWIVDRNGTPLATLVAEDESLQRPLTADQLGPYLPKAIIAIEDERFETHGGVDWRSVLGAMGTDVRSLAIKRGASTITMQLQRLRDPSPRTFANKLMQAIRAEQIERQIPKDQILLEYLNRAPFGGNLVGAGAASWRYFAKPLDTLSLAQAALLAGLPQNPNGLRPDRYPQRAKERRDRVLGRMRACGMIDASAYRAASDEPVDVKWNPLPQSDPTHPASPLANGAMPTLIGIRDSIDGVGSVTLDADVQRRSFEIVRSAIDDLNAAGSHAAAAAVVLDVDNAQCLAAINIGDRLGLDLTHRGRSTGSTLKPFIYAAAFQSHIATSDDLLSDVPTAWVGYAPRNFDHSYRGQIDAGAALAQSRNLPAMRLLAKVGLTPMNQLLGELGLPMTQNAGLTLAVGGAEASPWEVAQAYGTLARGGVTREAVLIGEKPAGATVFTHDACGAVLQALDDRDRTTELCAAAANLDVAWKTGTSSGSRDAWCAAVTPRRVVVVWVGNPSGGGDSAFKGYDTAAPMALKIMAAIDRGGANFERPAAASAAMPVELHRDPDVTITSPVEGEKIMLDPGVPADRQKVMLNCSASGHVWWFVDGVLAVQSENGAPAAWRAGGGAHVIRAVTRDASSKAVKVVVLGER